LIPPDRVLQTFNEFGYSLINRILDSALATQSLTKLRDTLLPKLISGELRIPDAEKLAEAALA
jgi:type I restriction enzyme S subunit